MKMKRRLLYEDPNDPVTGTNIKGHTNFENPLMKLAYNANCFKDFGFVPTKDQDYGPGGEAFYKQSTDSAVQAFPYMFLIPNQDGITFRLSYRDNTGTEKHFQARVACQNLEETTNPVKTADQQNIVNFLKDNNFFEFQEIKGKHMLNYELVDIAKDEYVRNDLIKKNPLLLSFVEQPGRTFWMWKGKSNTSGLSQNVLNLGENAQKLVDYLKGLKWTEGYPPPGQGGDYMTIDLSKSESYNYPELNGYGDYQKFFKGPFIMSKPKLTPNAKSVLDYLSGATGGGYVPLKSMSIADQTSGELEILDLSDEKQYVGNLYNLKRFASEFPKGYQVARKVDITQKDSAGSLNQDNCRQFIVDYYNDMMNNSAKTAPSLTEKRRVEACLTTFKGRYPKLKDMIDKLVTPPATRANYRIKYDDYTKGSKLTQYGLRGKSKEVIGTPKENVPAVQQESKDRLLKNIISENLVKLKKKQLLERTLSSRNTY